MKTIIEGLIYTDGEILLRPVMSGYYYMVDCIEYLPKKTVKELYDGSNASNILKGTYLTHKDKKYFECEVSPQNTNDMELLSDLSLVKYYDANTEF